MTIISSNIFKEYDIRGKIGKELNEDMAFRLGQLFAHEVDRKNIVVGKDNRPSSKALLKCFINGLLSSGCKVIELQGVSTSPYLYFASEYLNAKAAVMITGSHNSFDDNGFKFLLNNQAFYGKNLKEILSNPIINDEGMHSFTNLEKEYAATLIRNIKITKTNNIIWECNNSGVAKIINQISLPGNHALLNQETNEIFAHKFPDPLIKETLETIKQRVSNYDYGIAFDGDADRLVVIKKDGNELTSDQLIYLFALGLRNNGNKKIVVDVKVSKILVDKLVEEGFEVIIAPCGHSLMKERIIKENAIFAGESSGHIIFNDNKYFAFDDALYAALRLIEYLQNHAIIELPLAPIRKEYKIAKTHYLDPQIYKPEGLRISYPDGFLLIRASNTEDYILVKYEAKNRNTKKIIEREIQFQIK